jgi:uncharacterized protein YqgC (DUF456 family)
MDWLLWAILVIASAGSLAMALVGFPGLWFMLLLAVGYGWGTSWMYVGPWTLGALLVMVIVAEAIETLASALGARRAGASKRAMLLSMVGAIVGGIVLTPVLPVVGTIIGLCAGAFVGAVLGEVLKGRDQSQMVKSGLGAAAGRLAGTIVKVGIGTAMFVVVAWAALPVASSASSPSVMPATNPAPVIELERQ